jgi:septum site-determining protein MinC
MISIKGFRQGLLILFGDAENDTWASQIDELKVKLDRSGSFFQNARVAFDVKKLAVTLEELQSAKALLENHHVTLWAVASLNNKTIANTRRLNLSTDPNAENEDLPSLITTNGASKIDNPFAAMTEGTDGLLITKLVRSGQTIKHPGHVVIIGDVNPGAEIVAGNDIIVWGKLHGAAYAGSTGNEKAVICALELIPSILRIGNVTRRVPTEKRRKTAKPEMAKIENEEMSIIEWIP